VQGNLHTGIGGFELLMTLGFFLDMWFSFRTTYMGAQLAHYEPTVPVLPNLWGFKTSTCLLQAADEQASN
jgi:hypothetical protein